MGPALAPCGLGPDSGNGVGTEGEVLVEGTLSAQLLLEWSGVLTEQELIRQRLSGHFGGLPRRPGGEGLF